MWSKDAVTEMAVRKNQRWVEKLQFHLEKGKKKKEISNKAQHLQEMKDYKMDHWLHSNEQTEINVDIAYLRTVLLALDHH